MKWSSRQVEFFNLGKVLEQLFFKAVLTSGLIRLIALGVTIFAPMTATGIDIDAIAMAAWEVSLVGKRAIPFDNAWPCNTKDLFV